MATAHNPVAPHRPPKLSPREAKDAMERNIEMLVFNNVTTYPAMDPFRNLTPDLPFLLVPPVNLYLSELMGLILWNGQQGISFLSRKRCRDIVGVPTEAYLMLDVDDGSGHLNTPTSLSEDRIRNEGRSPHTIVEGILHVLVFPEKFAAHSINLCGSRERTGSIPHLLLDHLRGARLAKHFTDFPSPVWGTPSCKKRATLGELI